MENLAPPVFAADRDRAPKPDLNPLGPPVPDIAVIGCGNPMRRDDGVGPAVLRQLAKRDLGLGVRLLDAGTDGMAVMFAARGCKTLIVVDACRSGAPPGTVFEVPGAELERHYSPSLTMHDFRWNHALHAGRMIFHEAFPTDVIVLLVEAQSLEFGLDLSQAAAASVITVTQRIEDLLGRAPAEPDRGMTDQLSIARGSIYLSNETYERHFGGLAAVILLRRETDLAILPVRHGAAGGYLLKRRNAKGDRVVNADDFLRFHGIMAGTELTFSARWDTSIPGLVAGGAFSNVRSMEPT